jgi:hypothetical protein
MSNVRERGERSTSAQGQEVLRELAHARSIGGMRAQGNAAVVRGYFPTGVGAPRTGVVESGDDEGMAVMLIDPLQLDRPTPFTVYARSGRGGDDAVQHSERRALSHVQHVSGRYGSSAVVQQVFTEREMCHGSPGSCRAAVENQATAQGSPIDVHFLSHYPDKKEFATAAKISGTSVSAQRAAAQNQGRQASRASHQLSKTIGK